MADQEDRISIDKGSAKTHSTRSSAYRARYGPGSRASQGSIADAVTELTVRALQEFDTGEMPDPTAVADQTGGEAPAAGGEDGPDTELAPLGADSGDEAPDGSDSDRAWSIIQSPDEFKRRKKRDVRKAQEANEQAAENAGGSKPASASGSAKGSRPTSARPGSARPGSAQPGSARPGSGKPGSAAAEERPASGRPGSGRPGSGRPGSARPQSGRSAREGSAGSRRSVAQRLAEEQDQQLTARTTTPPAEIEGSIVNSVHDDGLPDDPVDQRPPYSGMVPPPTQFPAARSVAEGGDDGDNDGGDYGGDGGDDRYPAYNQGDVGQDLQEVEEDVSDDEENDLVVLDPEHPLMRRFQAALNKQLSAQHEKVKLEYGELSEALKRKLNERETLGVELYGVQQELARYQVLLEDNHDQYNSLNHDRSVKEQNLNGVRGQYKQMQLHQNTEKKKAADLQQEVENLSLRLFYVNNAKDDVRSDINVMKRAAERADTEVSAAESHKQKQDLYVDRLVEQVDKLREDIAITEAQLTAQLEETKAAREALSEASMEIENIQLEKKQLYAQWNSSLIGMKRRDEAHAAMQEANDQQRQRIKSLETEIEGYKKQIAKEEEHNEKLTLVLNKCEVDIATSKKLLDICSRKMDALKTEYSTYTRMLHETEEALNRANAEKIQRGHEIDSLRKQIEREYLEKVRLEDEIMEVIRNQLTFDKAAQYTDRITRKCRQLTKDLEAQIALVENEIANDSLSTVTTKARIGSLRQSLDELEAIINQKNDIINRSENESIKRNAVIERKQQIIDQFNKKLEQMISQAGGVELGPLEITINSLSKSIESTQQDIAHLQLMWLREQGELVRLSKENDQSNEDVNMLKKKISILSQKKIRIENAIEKENIETVGIEKNIRNLRNDMIKLNQMLHIEAGAFESLEKDNILTENAFVGNLKDAELESVQMQAKLDSLKEEKERLLNSLVESERQIMLWEKKTQLARETRAAVDSEIGQGEISAMKSEIHRMEVRYAQLMRQQEKMIQDMEKAVSRRDTIVTRGDAQAKIAARTKSKDKTVTKGTFQRQLGELRKKVKTTIQDAQGCDGELHSLREDQKQLGQMLESKQIQCRELEGNADSLDGDIERQLEMKQRNIADLIAKQQKTKYYQQVKDGKYKRVVKDDNLLEGEREKQIDKMQSLSNIVERLQEEYPHLQPSLRKVSLSLGTRIMEEGPSSARGSEVMA